MTRRPGADPAVRAGNLGQTRIRRKRRTGDPMRDYDHLPPELRAWLASALLPWGPRSARRAFDRALSATGSIQQALAALDRIERRQVARDTRQTWGDAHPFAAGS